MMVIIIEQCRESAIRYFVLKIKFWRKKICPEQPKEK
jgi:hypothetical protein